MNKKLTLPDRFLPAHYSKDPGDPAYVGNPLVEALPTPYSTDQVLELLEKCPPREPDVVNLPPHLRVHRVEQGLRFYAPLPIHVDLQGRIDRMIRNGYTDRNPTDPRWRREVIQRAKLLGPLKSPVPELWVDEDTTSTGLVMIGSSGMGKSRSIHRVLELYPQVIRHNGYRRRREFLETQIVHLAVNCPHNGSLLALITEIFGKIDRLANTNHTANYVRGGRSAEALLPYLAHVALLHHLGLLVVDEVQDLAAAGIGQALMLRFFVKLSNIVRIPIVLIGTPAATRILGGEFRQARRGSSQGDLFWDRLGPGRVWELFCETLQRYQYLRSTHTLAGPLGEALLRLGDGIIDVAILIYKRAQVRVIEAGGDEVLTVQELERTVEEDFQQVSALIRSRRQGPVSRLPEAQVADIDDIRPLFGAPTATSPPPLAPLFTTQPAPSDEVSTGAAAPHSSRAVRTRRTRPKPGERGLLPSLGVLAAAHHITIYEALRNAGLIKSPLDYLDGPVAS